MIEVVLVLAVAGLIFMVVFFAVPGMQRATRDHNRKQDMFVIAAAVRSYMGDNRGAVPPESDTVSAPGRDAEDERCLVMGLCDGWVVGDDSAALRPYIKGLNGSMVTTAVTVQHINVGSTVYIAIDDEERYGLVWVLVGGACSTTIISADLTKINATGMKSDIVIFRYLESGGFVCQAV